MGNKKLGSVSTAIEQDTWQPNAPTRPGCSQGGLRVHALEEIAEEDVVIEEEEEQFCGALTLTLAQPIMANACSKPEKSKNGWTKSDIGSDSCAAANVRNRDH